MKPFRVRLVALLALAALAIGTPARAASLEGVWISVLDPAGLVLSHIEEVRIGPGRRFETTLYALRDQESADGACANRTLDEGGPCALARPYATGTLLFTPPTGELSHTSVLFAAKAADGYGTADDQALARELMWLGHGGPWLAELSGPSLTLIRRSTPVHQVPGLDSQKELMIERRFHRVDQTFAGDLIGFAVAGEFSLAKMACVLPHVTDTTAGSIAFREMMGDAARVVRGRDAALAEAVATPSSVKAERAQLLMDVSTGAGDAQAIAAAASAFGVAVDRLERLRRELFSRPRNEAVDEILFTTLAPHHEAIRRCHAHWFE